MRSVILFVVMAIMATLSSCECEQYVNKPKNDKYYYLQGTYYHASGIVRGEVSWYYLIFKRGTNRVEIKWRPNGSSADNSSIFCTYTCGNDILTIYRGNQRVGKFRIQSWECPILTVKDLTSNNMEYSLTNTSPIEH